MKKQLLGLMVCATFFASDAAFCMNSPTKATSNRAAKREVKREDDARIKKQANDAEFDAEAQKTRRVDVEYYNLCGLCNRLGPGIGTKLKSWDVASFQLIDEKGQPLPGGLGLLRNVGGKFDETGRAVDCTFMNPTQVKLVERDVSCKESPHSCTLTDSGYRINCASDSKIGMRVTFLEPVQFYYENPDYDKCDPYGQPFLPSGKKVVYDFYDLLVPGQTCLKNDVHIRDMGAFGLLEQFVLSVFVVPDYTKPEQVEVEFKARKRFVEDSKTRSEGTIQGKTYDLPGEKRKISLATQKVVFVLEFEGEQNY